MIKKKKKNKENEFKSINWASCSVHATSETIWWVLKNNKKRTTEKMLLHEQWSGIVYEWSVRC